MTISERQAEKYLPLTEATYYILLSLSRPLHGYGVIQTVKEKSSGRVALGPGTLYGAFHRLLGQRLIDKIDEPDAEDDRRKLYVLTELGREVLRRQTEILQEMVRHGLEALSGNGGKDDDRR